MDKGAESYRRFLNGDESGLIEIIRDYKDGLIFYLNGFVGDVHTAEELAEDTFLRLATKKPRDRKTSSFKTWLYTIGRHIAVDWLRRKRPLTVPLDTCPSLADERDLEITYLREERKIQLHRAMRRLHASYRQVLWLVYFEGLTHKEIAAIMHKRVGTVETLAYRARAALKEQLRKDGFVYEEL